MQEIDGPLILTVTALLQIPDLLGLQRSWPMRSLTGGLILLLLYVMFADIRAPVSDTVLSAWTLAGAAILLVTTVCSFRKARRNELEQPTEMPSPARQAAYVILLTGGAIVAMLVHPGAPRQLSDLAIPAGAVAGTLVIAWLAWRFATENADQIGEARFDTSRAPGPGKAQE